MVLFVGSKGRGSVMTYETGQDLEGKVDLT